MLYLSWGWPMRTKKSQAVLEFAIVVPILCLLVMSVIDFGLMWSAKHTLVRLARSAGGLYSAQANIGWTEMAAEVENRKPQFNAWSGQTIVWRDQNTGMETVQGGNVVNFVEFNLRITWPVYTPLLQVLFGADTVQISTATAAANRMKFYR